MVHRQSLCYIVTASDNFPVIVSLNGDSNESKIITCKLKWNDNVTNDCFELIKSHVFEENDSCSVNEPESDLITTISDNAKNLGMIKSNKKFKCNTSKSWFDEECVNFKRMLKILLKECKESGFEDKNLWKSYNEQKKNIKKCKSLKKKNSIVIF